MRLVGFLGLGLVCATGACGTTPTEDDSTTFDCSTVHRRRHVRRRARQGRPGGLLDFQLMSADPAPPARGNNTWVVQIISMSSGVVGDPLDGASQPS